MKCYMVQVTDIWNNNYLVGFYGKLDDAIKDVNGYISEEKYHLQKGDLQEYASTLGSCFDCSVSDIVESRGLPIDDWCDDEDLQLMIRGYILDTEEVIREMRTIEGRVDIPL